MGDEARTGGFLTIADLAGQPLLVMLIGTSPEDRLVRYWRNSLEKALRTSLTGLASSRASRDQDRERWIGALRGRKLIGSFSGLPENFDEILVADVLVRTRDLASSQAKDLLNHNEDFAKLKHLFDWAA